MKYNDVLKLCISKINNNKYIDHTWTKRVEFLLNSLIDEKNNENEKFNVHHAMNIMNIDLLKKKYPDNENLKSYLKSLPIDNNFNYIDNDFPSIAHSQHLKIICVVIPILIELC